MRTRPILSTLRHHKLTAGLPMLQAAFTGAIVCDVVFMVANRVRQVSLPSGLAESGLSVLQVAGIEQGENPQARHAAVLNLLLMKHCELPRLPLWYLPVGVLVLWALGQLSVPSPALHAAEVPPVVATRSV